MTDIKELIARLRKSLYTIAGPSGGLAIEAAAAIERLTAERDAARNAALEDAALLLEEIGRLLNGNATPTPSESAASVRTLKGAIQAAAMEGG